MAPPASNSDSNDDMEAERVSDGEYLPENDPDASNSEESGGDESDVGDEAVPSSPQ